MRLWVDRSQNTLYFIQCGHRHQCDTTRSSQIYGEARVRKFLDMLRLSYRQEIPSTLRNPTVIPTQVHFHNMPLIRKWIFFLQVFREQSIVSNSYLSRGCLHSITPTISDINCNAPRHLLIGRWKGGILSLRTASSQPPHLTTYTYITSVHCDVTSVHCDVTSVQWRHQCPLWRYQRPQWRHQCLLWRHQCPLWRYQRPLWRYSAGSSNFSLTLFLSVRPSYRSFEIFSVSVN